MQFNKYTHTHKLLLCSVFCVLKHLRTRPFLKISSFVLIPLLLECKVHVILMYVLLLLLLSSHMLFALIVPGTWYVCIVITYTYSIRKSKDQPGKVANPARGQLNRKK